MELVAQQKPLAQAMDEVGLSVHEFFVLHRINSQLSTSTNENQQLQQYSDNSKVVVHYMSYYKWSYSICRIWSGL